MDLFSQLLQTNMEIWHLVLAFFAGLIGEGYATLVGSGGVLIQFTLAAIGLPLAVVVATDIGGSQGADFGIIAASSRKILNNKRLLFLLAAPVFIGGVVGTIFLVYIPVALLKAVLIIGLSLLLVYILMGRRAELQTFEHIHLSWHRYPLIFVVMFVLGVYGNISGVGVGTFNRFAYVSLLRVGFVESLGLTSLIALPPTLFSTIFTGMSGLIAWPYFITIFIGSFVGANFVSRYIRNVPEKYLRALLLTVIAFYLAYLVQSLF